MTKVIALVGLLGLGAMAGCTSYVKTYDSDMKLLAACKSGVTIFGIPIGANFFSTNHCVGSANPKDQTGGGTTKY